MTAPEIPDLDRQHGATWAKQQTEGELMKWTELNPVKKGQLIQMTVCGVSDLYRVLRNADDAMNLRIKDLKLEVPQ